MNEFQVRRGRESGKCDQLIQEVFEVVALAPQRGEESSGRGCDREGGSYRQALAGWPLKWRERWGRRANALEDLGLSWRTAEIRAFVEVSEARQAKVSAPRHRTLTVASGG